MPEPSRNPSDRSDRPAPHPPAGTVRGDPSFEPTHHGVDLRVVPAAEATLNPLDIGFRRGYAAFDYLRLVDGIPLFLEDHLERFENSARAMGLELPASRDALAAHLAELIEINDATEAGVQLFLTGGVAADGFTPSEPALLTLMTPLPQRSPAIYREGASLIVREHRRVLPAVKSNDYTFAVSLAREMREAGAADALYTDGDRALETTRSSLFVVTPAGRVVTPGRDILPGVTRANVLRALQATGDPALAVEERDVRLAEVYDAREVFITSTTKGALPIVRVAGETIGSGEPGPVTRRVGDAFAAHVEGYLATRR